MINLAANNWEDAWTIIHRDYAVRPESVIDQRFAARGMSFNNEISILNNDIGSLNLAMVGYGAYKCNIFDSRYIIPGKDVEILTTLRERAAIGRNLTVISYPFKSDNSIHTQGPCILNMVITMIKDKNGWRLEFDIYVRIAEITRRLLVDFIKFSELIKYFQDGLSTYNMKTTNIKMYSKVLYGEVISLTIAEHLFMGQFSYNQDYWLHKRIQKSLKQFEKGQINFHRGNNIRKHIIKLKESNHDTNTR